MQSKRLIYGVINLLLAIPFLNSIFNPINNINFIYKGSFALFLFEFIAVAADITFSDIDSVNVSVKVFGKEVQGINKRVSLISFFLILALVYSFIINSPQLTLFLIVSILIKAFQKSSNSDSNIATKGLALFISSIFLAIPLGIIASRIFPFPKEVILNNPGNMSGLFVDTPQTLLVWGLLYPVGLFLIESINLPSKKSSQHRS